MTLIFEDLQNIYTPYRGGEGYYHKELGMYIFGFDAKCRDSENIYVLEVLLDNAHIIVRIIDTSEELLQIYQNELYGDFPCGDINEASMHTMGAIKSLFRNTDVMDIINSYEEQRLSMPMQSGEKN